MTDHNEAMRLADAIDTAIKQTDADDHVVFVARWFAEPAAALIRKQAERIAELEADYQRLMDKHNALHVNALKDRTERDTLRAEVERLRKTDAEILACNYPDGEENGPTVAAPDFDLICFARQLGIIDTARKATQ